MCAALSGFSIARGRGGWRERERERESAREREREIICAVVIEGAGSLPPQP